jgi:hypothetical protein
VIGTWRLFKQSLNLLRELRGVPPRCARGLANGVHVALDLVLGDIARALDSPQLAFAGPGAIDIAASQA